MGSIVGTTLFFQENIGDNRLADFSDGGRHNQYADAIQQFSSSPFVGLGFGTKLERGSYVHNFVLGSAAMMGILGLLAALYIHATLLLAFAKGLLCPRDCNAAVFLIIPILSLTVGATFEGLFTVSGWLAITLFSVCEEKQALAIPQELEQPIGTTPFAEPIGTHA
jgi:O-antigen ligase